MPKFKVVLTLTVEAHLDANDQAAAEVLAEALASSPRSLSLGLRSVMQGTPQVTDAEVADCTQVHELPRPNPFPPYHTDQLLHRIVKLLNIHGHEE